MMELDSQSITPPSSPIIGYSGCDDEQSLIDSGVVYCLNCKGPPRLNDFSFSSESYILRREVISAVENLRGGIATNRIGEKPKLLKCFGHLFDPLDQTQTRKMILLCRKQVATLEILSDFTHTLNMMQNNDVSSVSIDPEDLSNKEPWTIRRNVCQFLNVLVRGLKYYKSNWQVEDFQKMFVGLKKSVVPIEDWSPVLKTHCGFRSGNECSSASYHFFHVQLELRWSLFLIFGASSSIANWLVDDLIQLAFQKYTSENELLLNEKQPFNCTCVKEIWTMIRLVMEHLAPQSRERPFWNAFVEAMQRCTVPDSYFSLWLTSYMAQISDYSISGVHCPGHGRRESKEKENNASAYAQGLLKEWLTRGGKSIEVLKLAFNFFQYWGGDCETLILLWTQWVPRLDRGSDVSNLESFWKIENWLKLITQICESSAELCGSLNEPIGSTVLKPMTNQSSRGVALGVHHQCLGSNKDPFLEFVFLVAAYSRWANEKEFQKLHLRICMKLINSGKCNANDFGELGIIRVASLFMALSNVTAFEKEAVSLCARLTDIFKYGKGKNSPKRSKAILRAHACMIIMLLRKKISLRNLKVASSFMKTVDELLCQTNSEPLAKDVVMVYIDLLDSLPTHTPRLCSGTDLGRYILVSSNLSMWFSNAGPNYVVRTARCLSQITEWIVKWDLDPNVITDCSTTSEGKELYLKISEKAMPFMKSNVILSTNRIPSTDLEPLANLAADLTLLTKTFKRNTEEENYFDLFAMNEHTCPLVSQFFVQRLLKNRDFIESSFSQIKWTQSWIRLVALDCSVPDELTEIVLANRFSSTSNQELLREFCKQLETYDREQIHICLTPLTHLLKSVMSGTLFKDETSQSNGAKMIKSVITSCVSVLKNIRFDQLYIRGNPSSVAHNILNSLLPVWTTLPWENFSSTVKISLERNLYDIFKVVALYPGLAQEPYLCRKLRDIVALSFFGFVRSPEDVDRNQHPAIKISDLSEEEGITLVQDNIFPFVVAGDQVVEDSKLCQLFINAVQMFRTKQLATAVMRVLSGVIRAFCKFSENQKVKNICVNTVVYCCLVGSSNSEVHNKLAVKGFEAALEKEFHHRSKIFFQLCHLVVASKNSTNGNLDARRFLKLQIIPLLRKSVEKSEEKRGAGIDAALRTPLQKLELEVANVPV